MKQLSLQETRQVAGGELQFNLFFNEMSLGVLVGSIGYHVAGPSFALPISALFTIGMLVPDVDYYLGLKS